MVTRYPSLVILTLILMVLMGCAGGGDKTSPVEPGTYEDSDLMLSLEGVTHGADRLLLGYWDVARNPDTGKFEVVPLRGPAFHVNVTNYLQNPNFLDVKVYKEIKDEYGQYTGEFELDVTLSHPFPNSDLRGFDVRGIIFGAGPPTSPYTLSSKDDPDLMWLAPGGLRLDNADGWTRWWNPSEFIDPGLFGYTEGIFGTSGFTCAATVNPYKYFADILTATSPVVGANLVDTTNRGTFSTDKSITRRYQLTFPMVGGYPDVRFQYAADASWDEPTGGGSVPGINDYPPEANCAEAFHLEVIDNSTAYYVSPTECGGDLVLDLIVYDWGIIDPIFTNIDDEIESISIECDTLFTGVVPVPVGSGSSGLSGVYPIAVPVTPTASGNHEVFVKVVSRGPGGPHTYEPPAGIPDDYPDDNDDYLSAFALVPVYVKAVNPNIVGGFESTGNASDIEVDGLINYFLDDVDGFVILDVSDTDNPFILNTVTLSGNPIAFDLQDGYAYVIDNTGNNLIVVEVDPVDGANVVTTFGLGAAPTAIDVDGNYAYISDTLNNLNIYDVSTPGSPSFVNSVWVPGINPPSDIVVRDGYAYVAADNFEIFNVEPPGSAALLNTVNTASNLVAVAVSETGYAFISDVSNDLILVDVYPIISAAIVDTLAFTGQVNDIKCDWNMVYVTVSGVGLKIVSFNESIVSLSVIGEVDTTADDAVSVEGNMAYTDGEIVIIRLWEEEDEEGETGGWARTWEIEQAGSWTNLGTAIDAFGDVYVAGIFKGTVDFYSGLEGVDMRDSGDDFAAFLVKYDSGGLYQWVTTWPEGSFYTFHEFGVTVGGNGNIYVTGHDSEDDSYMKVFDHIGTLLWEIELDGIYTKNNTLDTSGNIYITGFFEGTADFDPGPGIDEHTADGGDDTFLIKLDSGGSYLWGRSWGGADFAFAGGVAVNNGAVYIIGSFNETCDFDPGAGVDSHVSLGDYDVYLSQFDSSGSYSGVLIWGGTDADWGMGIAIDSSLNIYATGRFDGTVDFDPGVGSDIHIASTGDADSFVTMFDGSGSHIWANTWGNSSNDEGTGVAADNFGNVYVTGYFHGTVDFDPGAGSNPLNSNGVKDVYLSKFDTTGSYYWSRTWGGAGNDNIENQGVAIDASGNIFVAGLFNDTVDFNPGDGVDNHTAVSSNGAFLIKFLPYGYW